MTLRTTTGSVLLGVAVAVLGTGIHRANQPWGLVLALLLVLSAAVLARAWADRSALLMMTTAMAVVLLILGSLGPGEDLLIVAQPVGYAWYGSILVAAAAGVLPQRWFSDRPLGRSAAGDGT